MTSQNRLDRRLSGKHVVWFEGTNQWVAFEKPAYKVFKWREKGKSKKKIRSRIEKKYGLSAAEAKRFINEVAEWVDQLTQPYDQKDSSPKYFDCIGEPRIRNYKIKKRSIRVSFLHPKLESYFHPPIAHLEDSADIDNVEAGIKLCASKEGFFLIQNDVEPIYYNTIAELKHGFITCLMQIVHRVNPDKWLTWIHGSAVEKEGKAAIFTSPSGSGKSTIAAVLQSRSFRTLADDMVFLEHNSLKIYPVPTALSIKKGALKTVADMLNTPDIQKKYLHQIGKRRMAFIPPLHETNEPQKPVQAKYLIFIRYEKETELSIRELSDFEAFRRFHQNAWMKGTAEAARDFFDWFTDLEYYELIYSDTNKAMTRVETLFRENP